MVSKYITITVSHFQLFKRGKKERPRSADVSSMYFESLDSTQATTATQLWIPKPLSRDPVSKAAKVSYPRMYLISHSGVGLRGLLLEGILDFKIDEVW